MYALLYHSGAIVGFIIIGFGLFVYSMFARQQIRNTRISNDQSMFCEAHQQVKKITLIDNEALYECPGCMGNER